TVAASWGSIGESIKREAEIRQEFAANLSDEVTKPMRELNESFHKSRKPIEVQVEKSIRTCWRKRAEEATAKKKAYCSAKEPRRLGTLYWQERKRRAEAAATGDAKADKDASKRRSVAHCQASMSKCDKDYYDACLRAELARLDWRAPLLRAAEQLQALETDRLRQTHEMLERYPAPGGPAGAGLRPAQRPTAPLPLSGADIEADIGTVVEQRGARCCRPASSCCSRATPKI
uniref:F-BAR domain-containing protein n=1 Tax=Macrostomum lignano TaxID=282301 RepID=A0A1I8F6P5_9PLAT